MAEARPAPARVRVTGVVKKSEPNTQAWAQAEASPPRAKAGEAVCAGRRGESAQSARPGTWGVCTAAKRPQRGRARGQREQQRRARCRARCRGRARKGWLTVNFSQCSVTLCFRRESARWPPGSVAAPRRAARLRGLRVRGRRCSEPRPRGQLPRQGARAEGQRGRGDRGGDRERSEGEFRRSWKPPPGSPAPSHSPCSPRSPGPCLLRVQKESRPSRPPPYNFRGRRPRKRGRGADCAL
ncbi:unnamed protein product [Symbiodinium sp. CCMP2456]|nr:unnamed protein product [Symbiodinium sp. CCMP2456]